MNGAQGQSLLTQLVNITNYGSSSSSTGSSSSCSINDEEVGEKNRHSHDDDENDNDDGDGSSHEIGYIGSFAIAINSLAGPAVLQLPFQYQQSGFIATTIALCCVAIVSMQCSLYICKVVSAIPHTAKLERPIELSTAVEYFWNHRAYLITQWLFFACTFCLNVAAMIDTAQVVDTAIGVSSGYPTFGYSPLDGGIIAWKHPKCTRKQVKLGNCDPFVYNDGTEQTGPILTLGYLITAIVFLPLCLMDLKENTSWQIGGCFLLLTLCVYFCTAFLNMNAASAAASAAKLILNAATTNTTNSIDHVWTEEALYYNATLERFRYDDNNITQQEFHHQQHQHDLHRRLSSSSSSHGHNLPLWGREYRDLLGVILFNFALVLALPAWMHTKKSNVKVHKVVYGSTFITTLLYVGVGSVVAMSIPQANQNMLAPMVSGAFGTGIQAASSVFCFFIIGLDIPLFCVLTRYNLSKLLPNKPWLVNALVVYIPWGMSWFFYQGDAIATLLDWGGVLLTSAIAFLLPLYLAYRVLMYTDLKLRVDDDDDKDDNDNADAITEHSSFISTNSAVIPNHHRRRQQIRTVTIWLMVTFLAVILAIGGQIAVQAEKYAYLHSEEYLNDNITTGSDGTTTFQK